MRQAVFGLGLLVVLFLVAATSQECQPVKPSFLSQVCLDEPPQVASPTSTDRTELSEAARRIEPASMQVSGDPRGASGTAFVISKKHRLLATNAHVAKIIDEVGAMLAVQNGSHRLYQVEKVWFHPDQAEAMKSGVALRKGING